MIPQVYCQKKQWENRDGTRKANRKVSRKVNRGCQRMETFRHPEILLKY